MITNIKIIPIFMALAIGIILQIGFILVDKDDSPYRAVREFSEAYFNADKSMKNRMCEESKTIGGIDVVDAYLYSKTKVAEERGFDPSYLNEKINHMKLTSAECEDCGDNKAKIRVTGYTSPGIKAFFTGEAIINIDEVITVIKEEGEWKVCGNLFALTDI